MMRFGTFLAFVGFGSALLHFTSVQLRLLIWAEPFQPGLGLGIGALGAVVIIIKVMTSKEHTEEAGPFGPPMDEHGGQPQQFFGPPPGQQSDPRPQQSYQQQPQYQPHQQPVPGGQYPPPGPMGPQPGHQPAPQQF